MSQNAAEAQKDAATIGAAGQKTVGGEQIFWEMAQEGGTAQDSLFLWDVAAVVTPLPDIPAHIVEAKLIGWIAPDRG